MEGPELATPEEPGSRPRTGSLRGRRGKDSSGFQAGPAPLSRLPHFIREYASLFGKKSSLRENLIPSSSFRTASGTDAPHTPLLMVIGEGVLNTPVKPVPLPSPQEGRCLKLSSENTAII